MPLSLQPTHPVNGASGAKVLLVDDDQDLTEALALTLRRAGFQPLQAASLPAAMELFNAEQPDLAVLDVNLGPWSGLDLLEQLRKRSSMPILMLTGAVSDHVEDRSIELGADDVLIKPIGTRHLIARIRARLAQNQRVREEAEVHVQLNVALRDLSEARDRLVAESTQAIQARNQLLAAVAHDLQTPLLAIVHLTHRRRLRSAPAVRSRGPDPLARALEQIENHAARMTRGFKQLLALAELDIEEYLQLDAEQTKRPVELHPARRQRVLVVEDDETIRTTVIDLLDRHGYLADGAADGERALAKLHEQRADAIVLDLRMPVMDGWTFVERYRDELDSDEIPIIVISAAHDLASSAERLRALGVRVCLAKPFDVDALLAVVERFAPRAA